MNEVTKRFWETTYRQSIAKMIGVCYRYTYDRQTAEDLAHDAFLVAIDKAVSFENKGPFEAWLRRIVVNVALQYFREQKKQKDHLDRIAYEITSIEFPEEMDSPPGNTFSEVELLGAIRLLPEHHRLVFNLYVFDGFTHTQIGAELGISEGTSKSHLARARKKIREILKNQANQNKQRKRFFLLFLLPDRLGIIDQLFRRHLNDVEIPPQQASLFETVHFRKVSISKSEPTFYFPETFMKTDLATLALVLNIAVISFLQFNAYKQVKGSIAIVGPGVPVSGELQSKKITDKRRVDVSPSTATFSTNSIIASKKTKTIYTMKKVNTLGALLLTSSALAFDSTSLLAHSQQPISFKTQAVAENHIREIARPIEPIQPAPKLDTKKIVGTFYASELFWSAENNELYVKGNQVKVSLNTQKFRGSGTFSFLDKVGYLVVDGDPIELNETIQLSDKKYGVVKLTQAEATQKYGDKAKLGVVEITLAE